jgi:hypothetical protein
MKEHPTPRFVMPVSLTFATLVSFGIAFPVSIQLETEEADFTKVEPEKLGVAFVKPMKDAKTGFLVGGKNATKLIRQLKEINGRNIADLERDMRPGNNSTAGFLGKDEALLEILALDNDFVLEKHGLTHQELARHLHILGAIAAKHAPAKDGKTGYTFLYHGKKLEVKYLVFKFFAKSPFEDGTKTNEEVTVTNLGTGKKLVFARLVPHMIERYGFYEGKGTRFRVDPQQILEVLDFIPSKR